MVSTKAQGENYKSVKLSEKYFKHQHNGVSNHNSFDIYFPELVETSEAGICKRNDGAHNSDFMMAS